MNHLKTILSVMVLMLTFSCTKNSVEGNGQVSFALSSNLEIADQTRSSVSQFTSLPNSGDFIITVKDASGATVWTGKLSEWDAATLLPVGEYTATATYGNLEEEGFDKPFFTGSSSFTVAGAQTTKVSITVSLGNTVILINCTENFRKYYEDYTFTLVRDNATIATFVKGETKAAFVDGYKITLQGTVKSYTKTQSFSKEYTNLNEATAYTVVFDAANVGGGTVTISFNNSVETVQLGDVELND